MQQVQVRIFSSAKSLFYYFIALGIFCIFIFQSLHIAYAILEHMKEQSSKFKKSKMKINSLEKQAKLDSAVTKQMKLDLVTEFKNEMLAMQLLLRLRVKLLLFKSS